MANRAKTLILRIARTIGGTALFAIGMATISDPDNAPVLIAGIITCLYGAECIVAATRPMGGTRS